MLTNIFLGTIALYVAVEFATAVYILANRRTAIPRIRANLRYVLGLDRDAERFEQATREVGYEVERTIYLNEANFQAIAESLASKNAELRTVIETNNVVKLTARRKNGKR